MALAQVDEDHRWVRPEKNSDPSVWGMHGGIVFSLWPYGLEGTVGAFGGGPRGLIRVGYEHEGNIYHMNFIAIEPVVNGKMEFSEISESVVDNKWGKLIWAGNDAIPGSFYPTAGTTGVISKLDSDSAVEQLTLFLFMERFSNGAAPYIKVSMRSDRPDEICFELFHHENSASMDRCALTATMGNYARLREIYLDGQVVNSKDLYGGYDEIDFIEKAPYPFGAMLKDANGDFIVLATTDESQASLSSWPEHELAKKRMNWRYRPDFQLTQYWRKESNYFDPSLQVRVNGRARYWGGGSRDKNVYMPIPNGPSFENFELREKYYPGQKFFFGMTKKSVDEILLEAR